MQQNSTVEGFSVIVQRIGQNLAKNSEEAHFFEDYYHHVLVIHDGSNPFVVTHGFWEAQVVSVTTNRPLRIHSEREIPIIPLSPGEQLLGVTVTETSVSDAGRGIWVFIRCRGEDEEIYAHSFNIIGFKQA